MEANKKQIEAQCLALVKQKIKEEKKLDHLQPLLSDEFILRFVRGRKYRADFAFDTLKRYFQVREDKYRDYFLGILPSKIRLNNACAKPLKHFGPGGHVIVFTKIEWWPPLEQVHAENLIWDDVLTKFLIVFEELWKNENVNLCGIELITDVENITFAQVKWLIRQLRYFGKLLNIFHRAFPLRLKAIHLINPPKYLNNLVILLRPLDPAGYLKRVYAHHNELESLFDHIPPNILPKSLKGELEDVEAFDEDFHYKSLANDKYFESLHQYIKKTKL